MLTLRWDGELRFTADSGSNQLQLDSNSNEGVSPTEALLASLAGCMAIDVVDILNKMRQPPERFEIEINGTRNEDPPRYFKSVDLVFRLEGDVSREKAERAIALSFEKYCSVYHSLRPDLAVTHRIEIS